ncbi:putative transposase [Rhodovulum imhoffii]|uniref:Putative transposase n=1 Tax=Rhodovulum imhoffii TaxID=365340 RepID=A0A2T5B7H8_9RHOB|nr:putative transposase [Rhodovulum imhoffii]
MTNRDHKLSLARQAELLGISRGSLYYDPRPACEDDLKLMRRIDDLHMEYPFAGSRMMKGLLRQEGFTAGRVHVATCMKRMGIQALYRRPNTSKPAPGHKAYPYLLRKLAVTRPNQVWAMDITYIPMARGFVYLVAVLDWFSRKVLAWRLSTTLETWPCIDALKDAMRRHGKPEIMNTDQGSQFTSIEFIKTLKDADIQISMDGKGAWRDNVFVERLWRTIKYEEVYLRAYDSVSAARESLARYLKFYNTRRPHSSLDGRTPDQAYLNPSVPIPVAA